MCMPSAMRRALVARDGGCCFPGCHNKRFVDAHHIVHWADGGDTNLDNLTLFCRMHHRYLHEYGFQLERAGRELRFLRPDGSYVADVPRLQECESDAGCDALRDAHASPRLPIDAATAVCRWNGASADYNWMVGLMQERISQQPTAPGRATLHMERARVHDAIDDAGASRPAPIHRALAANALLTQLDHRGPAAVRPTQDESVTGWSVRRAPT